MEVVAAISSVAGILSLLGQAIDNSQQLRRFLSDISSASEIIGRFLHDSSELLQTLDAVNHINESLPSSFYGPHIAFLQAQLEDYTRDVFPWLKTARAVRPASNMGFKECFKRFFVAASDRFVRDMREDLCRHDQTIGLSFSILGW
ncbi:hypothetical protein N7G274_007789 [Stereocaulon virgatum]|uniref:Fungal N-terminal domain-containing protein n=1 Tax=Stereocaulon virgatum TaxID=373712 RepID=A0ABR4A0Q6_9LECA